MEKHQSCNLLEIKDVLEYPNQLFSSKGCYWTCMFADAAHMPMRIRITEYTRIVLESTSVYKNPDWTWRKIFRAPSSFEILKSPCLGKINNSFWISFYQKIFKSYKILYHKAYNQRLWTELFYEHDFIEIMQATKSKRDERKLLKVWCH